MTYLICSICLLIQNFIDELDPKLQTISLQVCSVMRTLSAGSLSQSNMSPHPMTLRSALMLRFDGVSYG